MKSIPIDEFVVKMREGVLLDVRTPAEFEKAHIPGAQNLPLFTNEERIIIGTLYKQMGRQPAILKGLDLTGPKMKEYIKKAEALAGASSGKLFLYCWRGGMRSSSMAWLLNLYGFDIYVLKRGYKAFRNYALQIFDRPLPLLVLGGKTGSGKTLILHELAKREERIIDLEALAHHKGSAFGTIGEFDTCSQEHFENKLAMEWLRAAGAGRVWIEDESRSIGKKIIPESVWNQMRMAPVINLERPLAQRVDFLVQEYGAVAPEELLAAALKIKKRLGGLAYKLTVGNIETGELGTAAGILLGYYDKAYRFGLENRLLESIQTFETSENDNAAIAAELLKFADLKINMSEND